MIKKSEKIKKIAERLIANDTDLAEIKEEGVKIVYLLSDIEKTQNRKVVFGDCTKVAERYRWCCPYDFMITIYEPNVVNYGLNAKQKRALVKHELLHVGIDYSGNEPSYYVAPHDIEDFRAVINEYGLEWSVKG